MYFITERDPNYAIKGSRDPLGFQSIWQEAGRRLIPYLSTVSNDVSDFQIICYAHAFKKILQIDNAPFEAFFMKFEQMMAYARWRKNSQESFNGIDKVRKVMSNNPKTIQVSTSVSHQLLANQKVTGIWGKYIRPFTDMQFMDKEAFDEVFISPILSNSLYIQQANHLLRGAARASAVIDMRNLDNWAALMHKPRGNERQIFSECLLTDTCEMELNRMLHQDPSLKKLDFYQLIKRLMDQSKHNQFIQCLKDICHIEHVLSPLNRVFRYLQTKPYWTNKEIESDPYISKWKQRVDSGPKSEMTAALKDLLSMTNLNLVAGLISRNLEVCKKRNTAAWMQANQRGVEVYHTEGAFFDKAYDPRTQNDFSYFLPTFIRLHNQLN